MKGLMKSAASLPRFALDCGFWRTRRYAGASPAVVGLQTAAVSYCHEHGSDGWIPDDGLATSLGFKEREVAKLVPEMLRRNIWRPADDGGFEVVGYLDHNPSRAQVKEDRQKRSDAGAKGNHDRWHENRVVIGCPFCPMQGSQVRSESESVSDPTRESQEKTREDERREEHRISESDASFAAFWEAYPRKEGKIAAEKAWPKATKAADGDHERIVLGAKRFATDPNRTAEFTPHPTTWLNAGRWDDEPLPARLDRNGHEAVRVNPSLPEWQRR